MPATTPVQSTLSREYRKVVQVVTSPPEPSPDPSPSELPSDPSRPTTEWVLRCPDCGSLVLEESVWTHEGWHTTAVRAWF